MQEAWDAAGNGLQARQESTSANMTLFRVRKQGAPVYRNAGARLWLVLSSLGHVAVGAAVGALCLSVLSASAQPAAPSCSLLVGAALAALAYTALRTAHALHAVVEEQLVFFRELGVLRIVVRAGGGQTKDFVESTQIESVLINEAISCWSVVFYLLVLLKKADKPVLLAFQHLRPSLPVLRAVVAEAQRLLAIKRAPHR